MPEAHASKTPPYRSYDPIAVDEDFTALGKGTPPTMEERIVVKKDWKPFTYEHIKIEKPPIE